MSQSSQIFEKDACTHHNAAAAKSVNTNAPPVGTPVHSTLGNSSAVVVSDHTALLRTQNELLEANHGLLQANNQLLKALNLSLSSYSQAANTGDSVLAFEQSPAVKLDTTSKRKLSDQSLSRTNACDVKTIPSKRPRASLRPYASSTGGTKYYCGICQSMRKQTPRTHMHKHLLETCPSLQADHSLLENSGEVTDHEEMLLGCGCCASTGHSRKFHGDAFLGATRLAQHIVDAHCPEQPGHKLVWDNNNAINNLLTSRVFSEEYEGLRQLRYTHVVSAALAWPPGDHANALLYDLERLGGKIMAAAEDETFSLQSSVRDCITRVLEAAYVPISEAASTPACSSDFNHSGSIDRHDEFDFEYFFDDPGNLTSNGSRELQEMTI